MDNAEALKMNRRRRRRRREEGPVPSLDSFDDENVHINYHRTPTRDGRSHIYSNIGGQSEGSSSLPSTLPDTPTRRGPPSPRAWPDVEHPLDPRPGRSHLPPPPSRDRTLQNLIHPLDGPLAIPRPERRRERREGPPSAGSRALVPVAPSSSGQASGSQPHSYLPHPSWMNWVTDDNPPIREASTVDQTSGLFQFPRVPLWGGEGHPPTHTQPAGQQHSSPHSSQTAFGGRPYSYVFPTHVPKYHQHRQQPVQPGWRPGLRGHPRDDEPPYPWSYQSDSMENLTSVSRQQKKYKRIKKSKSAVCAILFTTALVFLVIAIPVAIVLSVNGMQLFGDPVNVDGSFRITNWQFSNKLVDDNTPEYFNYSNKLCSEITKAMLSTAVSKMFQGCAINGFSNGSVVTDFRIDLISVDENADPSEMKKSASKEFVSAVKSGVAFQGIDIDPSSLTFGDDVDDCMNVTCWDKSQCIDGTYDYTCECLSGYELQGNTSCTDIDECLQETCSHNCFNTEGSFACLCPTGYELDTDDRNCIDLDECVKNIDGCHMYCSNTAGSFACGCPILGYTLNDDGIHCDDIDECSSPLYNCPPNTQCENHIGNYSCINCGHGYEIINNICQDIDECATSDSGSKHKCYDDSHCTNKVGLYECTCPTGFDLQADGFSCEDIDECAQTPPPCHSVKHCNNIVGSYLCSCPEGFELNNRRTCLDIDECTTGQHNCESDDLCNNEDGGYSCSCSAGYFLQQDGHTCIDKNECMLKTDQCVAPATCENQQGSYRCDCPSGYSSAADGFSCDDINECTEADHGCYDAENHCHNSVGSYTCSCPGGYTMDANNNCNDINECDGDGHNCYDAENHCHNEVGGYRCSCPNGYNKVDDNNCIDINECDEDTHECDAVGTCLNRPGAYQCVCPVGYSLSAADHKTCNDIDECADRSLHDCYDNVNCDNVDGNYTCTCPNGYDLHTDGRTCNDSDECLDGNGGCDLTATCENTEGSFLCRCEDGYINFNLECRDIDECTQDTDNCQGNTVCVNTDGSYVCNCSAGYQLDAAGLSCEDINECETGTDDCMDPFVCVNNVGTFDCQCKFGFVVTSDGGCVALVDECGSNEDNNCVPPATCVDKDIGYRCECPVGVTPNPDGRSCDCLQGSSQSPDNPAICIEDAAVAIVIQPQNRDVGKKEDVDWVCNYDEPNLSNLTALSWYKGNVRIASTSGSKRIEKDPNGYSLKLIIENVKPGDKGTYSCKGGSNGGTLLVETVELVVRN